MDSLPDELLNLIASHLDIEPPSSRRFNHEPSPDLTFAEETPLKLLSQASKRWRRILLPVLFRYTRIELETESQWAPIDARLIDNMATRLTSLSAHEFQIYTKMRTRFKSTFATAFNEDFDQLLVDSVRVRKDDLFLKSSDSLQWLPGLSARGFADFTSFVSQSDLKRHIKSVIVYTNKEYELRRVTNVDTKLRTAVSEIWYRVFSDLEPNRLVVVAPPATMAALLDTSMLTGDVWAFDMKCHFLELRRDESVQYNRPASARPLILQRPWYYLAYNEGSSITAYSTYEYHLKQSPKMLYLVLARLAKEVPDSHNIRSFAFTGVFPFSTNVTTVLRALSQVRTLETVRFKLAAGSENSLLRDPKRMLRALPHDLWMEWNESYKAITKLLQDYRFRGEGWFVSDDCGEPGLEKEVDEHMANLRESGSIWTKTQLGCWKKEEREVQLLREGSAEAAVTAS